MAIIYIQFAIPTYIRYDFAIHHLVDIEIGTEHKTSVELSFVHISQLNGSKLNKNRSISSQFTHTIDWWRPISSACLVGHFLMLFRLPVYFIVILNVIVFLFNFSFFFSFFKNDFQFILLSGIHFYWFEFHYIMKFGLRHSFDLLVQFKEKKNTECA